MLIEVALRDLGCVVVGPVGDVAQALAALERETVDGALLDDHLGGARSYSIADALAARGVPSILVTGYGEEGLDQRYAPPGCRKSHSTRKRSSALSLPCSSGRLRPGRGAAAERSRRSSRSQRNIRPVDFRRHLPMMAQPSGTREEQR